MDSPRSAHRAASSCGDHGEATRSGSKISMPWKPAAAAAVSLSSRVPDKHTVAIDRCGAVCSADTSVDLRLGDQIGEGGEHPVGVGLHAREEPEGLGGLEDC